jgi:hypothetical protein
MKSRLIVLTGILLVLMVQPAARAQTVYAEEWEWDLAPYYLWLPSMSGNATVMGTPAPVEIKPGDVLQDLAFVFDFHLEGTKRSNGFWLDATYLNMTPTEETPGGPIENDLDITLAEAFGFRRLNSAGARSSFDLTYGVRYWSIESELKIPEQPSIKGDQGWTDVAIGARLLTYLDHAEKWSFTLRGDVGGGGSDFTWSTSALFIRRYGKRVALLLGYRALAVDYSTGSGESLFEFDVKMNGLLAGFNIQWPKR